MFHCRAIIIRNGEIIPMSREFTPETERQRLQFLVRKTFLLTPFLLKHLLASSQSPVLPAGLLLWWGSGVKGSPMAGTCCWHFSIPDCSLGWKEALGCRKLAWGHPVAGRALVYCGLSVRVCDCEPGTAGAWRAHAFGMGLDWFVCMEPVWSILSCCCPGNREYPLPGLL